MRRLFKKVSSRTGSRSRDRQGSRIDADETPRSSADNYDNVLGLSKIAEGDCANGDSIAVDIVAVHGLNGQPMSTWTHSNGTCWLRDLLPQSLPGARVFTYGYPSIAGFTTSTATIRDYALRLLGDLQEVNRDGKSRPIIFVCHSLGGIVVKQAMILADEKKAEFHDIWVNSQAIIFMGTPHKGSSSAEYGYILGRAADVAVRVSGARLLTGSTNSALLRNLRRDSEQLWGISQSFIARSDHFHIASFYETEQLPLTKSLIVERDSAILGLPLERIRPLYLHHRDLCRFSGLDDPNYRAVCHEVLSFAELIAKPVHNPNPSLSTNRSYDADEKKCMEILNSINVVDYQSRLHEPVNGTLDWISTNEHYLDWRYRPESGLLWISGLPGSGKTTLAAYINNHLRRSSDNVLVCRFYCDNKIEGQRNAISVLQNLIFQIINRRRRLVRLVRKTSDEGGVQIFRQFDALWNLFVKLANYDTNMEINIIIDAIDECESAAQSLILKRISEFINSKVPTATKFLITSRPSIDVSLYIKIKQQRMSRLDLENNQAISDDIGKVVSHRLDLLVEKGKCRPRTRDMLEKTLIAHAGRTFLWVDLVLQYLEKRRMISQEDVSEITHYIPSNLKSAYERLLDSIPDDDRPMASRMLRIIAVSSRPLSGAELGTLMTMDSGTIATSQLSEDLLVADEHNAEAILGPLVRVSHSNIELVHQSLKDFLVELDADDTHPLRGYFGINMSRDSGALATLCMAYLKLRDFNVDIYAPEVSSATESSFSSPISGNNRYSGGSFISFNLGDDRIFKDDLELDHRTCQNVSFAFPLFDYASRFWATDFAKGQDGATIDQHRMAVDLCRLSTVQATNWFRYFWFSNYLESSPHMSDPAMLLAHFGLEAPLQWYLKSSWSDISKGLSQATVWASRAGHDGCLKRLIQHTQFDSKLALIQKQTPLCAAAEYGHADCVTTLLDHGQFDPNYQNDAGRTALSLAAGNGHLDTVRILLSHISVSTDYPDKSNATPLFWAVVGGSVSVVDLMLNDNRIDTTRCDRRGGNALSWAAVESSEEIVSKLVHSGKFDPAQKDQKGLSPLSYAITNSRLSIVTLLVRSKQVKISDRDNQGRNAISLAASQRNGDILRYLIKHDKTAATAEDDNGWTPIQWALDPPGYPENVMILLKMANISINARDNVRKRPTLSWASAYGYSEIVRALVSSDDIDVEARDADGRTALSYAAGHGKVDAMESLLEKGADIKARDSFGRTAMFWSVIEGQYAASKFLLSKGAPARVTDETGKSLVDVAREHHRADIEELLATYMQ